MQRRGAGGQLCLLANWTPTRPNDNNNIKATWELSLSGALGPQPSAASHTYAYMVHDTFPHLDSQPGSPDLKLALSVAPRASDLADSDRPTSRNKLQRSAWLSFHSRHRDQKQLGTCRWPSSKAAGRTRSHGQTFESSVVRCARYCAPYLCVKLRVWQKQASTDCRLIWHRATWAPHDMMRPVSTTDQVPTVQGFATLGRLCSAAGCGRWVLVSVVGYHFTR